jgi:hypothetical protein
MRVRSIFKLALLAQLSLAPALLSAQIQTKKVSFAAGKSSTTLSGTIKGEKTIDYLVSAKEGQQMSVTLTSKNSSLYFNVLPPGSKDEAIFIGSSEGNNLLALYQLQVNIRYVYSCIATRREVMNLATTVSPLASPVLAPPMPRLPVQTTMLPYQVNYPESFRLQSFL